MEIIVLTEEFLLGYLAGIDVLLACEEHEVVNNSCDQCRANSIEYAMCDDE